MKSASQEKSLKTSRASPAAVVIKETKAPFAMYGWAEKEVEVGCKKTYNVGASALPGQVSIWRIRLFPHFMPVLNKSVHFWRAKI